LIEDKGPEAWDLPPKPQRMRWRTYQRLEAKYDEAEEALDHQLCNVVARLLNGSPPEPGFSESKSLA
jgi:hypothetical protein